MKKVIAGVLLVAALSSLAWGEEIINGVPRVGAWVVDILTVTGDATVGGKLGVGTTSPQTVLHGYGTGSRVDWRLTRATSTNGAELGSVQFDGLDSGSAQTIYSQIVGGITSSTNGAERGYLNFEVQEAAGLGPRFTMVGRNAGFNNASPKDGGANYANLHLGTKGGLGYGLTNGYLSLTNHVYIGSDGNWKYSGGSEPAMLQTLLDGTAIWRTAPGGTVDADATLTERMSLTSAGLRLDGANARVNEFSTDGTMAGNSDTAVPTEKATKSYCDLGGWSAVPASAAATGTTGMKAYDADYLYVCVATDTWVRFAKAAW